jgi:hypothetical protein
MQPRDMQALRKSAIKRRGVRGHPTRSALVRGGGAAAPAGGHGLDLLAHKSGAKKSPAEAMAHFQKPLPMLPKPELKGSLHEKGLGAKHEMSLRSLMGTRSSLVRGKTGAESGLLSEAEKLRHLKKPPKKSSASELAGLKKAPSPLKKASLKDLEGLAQARHKVALKSLMSSRSALVRHRGGAGKLGELESGLGGLTGKGAGGIEHMLSKVKGAHKPSMHMKGALPHKKVALPRKKLSGHLTPPSHSKIGKPAGPAKKLSAKKLSAKKLAPKKLAPKKLSGAKGAPKVQGLKPRGM